MVAHRRQTSPTNPELLEALKGLLECSTFFDAADDCPLCRAVAVVRRSDPEWVKLATIEARNRRGLLTFRGKPWTMTNVHLMLAPKRVR